MNKLERHQYYGKKFSEIPQELFPKIKSIFDKNLNENWKRDATKRISDYGLNFWLDAYHFSTGMALRNLLRNNGINDNLFPDQNLDDYYVPMLEWWLGYRRMKG